jgi:hypothetical protein
MPKFPTQKLGTALQSYAPIAPCKGDKAASQVPAKRSKSKHESLAMIHTKARNRGDSDPYPALLARFGTLRPTLEIIDSLFSKEELRVITNRHGLSGSLKIHDTKPLFTRAVLRLLQSGLVKIQGQSSVSVGMRSFASGWDTVPWEKAAHGAVATSSILKGVRIRSTESRFYIDEPSRLHTIGPVPGADWIEAEMEEPAPEQGAPYGNPNPQSMTHAAFSATGECTVFDDKVTSCIQLTAPALDEFCDDVDMYSLDTEAKPPHADDLAVFEAGTRRELTHIETAVLCSEWEEADVDWMA